GLISGQAEHAAGGAESGSIASDFGWNQLLASGARISLSAANQFLRFFTGNKESVATTLFSGTVTQPILRGFGTTVVLEPLIQAERDVIYQIRGFERYRQNFAVQIASDFYRV